MKIDEIREMTSDQRDDAFAALKKEQLNLRFQRVSGQLEKTARIREVRRTLARIKTVMTAEKAKG